MHCIIGKWGEKCILFEHEDINNKNVMGYLNFRKCNKNIAIALRIRHSHKMIVKSFV